jgi:ADP-heptose:LPS heptosyltransferase
VAALLDLLGTVSLETRRAPLFKRLLAERLRLFHTNAEERRAVVDLMRRAHRGPLRLLSSRELSTADRLLWLALWSCLGAARRVGWRPAARLLEKAAAGSAYVRQYGLRSRATGGSTGAGLAIDATLVTRAMGGFGDVLMMTPGLHALKAMRPGRPVILAIPRRFFPLFDGNDDVQLMDIDGDLDPASYGEWFNLTDCPAARVESRTAPGVTANRIELFARGLGITGSRLKTMDRRPRYTVSDPELEWRDQFFADHELRGTLVVGLQPRTDEAYRGVPHMRQIGEALAQHARVLVFGCVTPPDAGHPGVIQVTGLDLRQSFALASGCDVLVAPDSVFFHLAGALGLPCVGLFGPTDGRVRGRDYPRARILDARRTLSCIPCWRSEAIPCGLTGLRPSACLGEIDPAEVVRAVHESVADARRGLTSR